jgi:gamma-glutamyltranspeptidase/glutathione hydrolase
MRVMPLIIAACAALSLPLHAATQKPVLHGKQWVAVTGKPLAATSGAMTFMKGGNAVDAACTMLATTSTMWDVLSWGGETQALIWHPGEQRVIGINALGVAPTGASVDFYRGKDMPYPPEYGPLAAVTPGTPGGLMVMLAEYGTLSLAEVLAPAIEMAEGYPLEQVTSTLMERHKERLKGWPDSAAIFITKPGEETETAVPGEIFVQSDLAAMLRKLVEAEAQALEGGASRKDAIYAAYDRFYKGDIAEEFVRGAQANGALITREDLANWEVKIEEPAHTTYKGIDVYKLTVWTQGPAMLQALNILENIDLKSMGYNSADYIHTLYQAISLAFADRDFYYGDPYFPPEEPVAGLLSKDYAKQRAATLNPERNDPTIKPGDPYPFQRGKNPFLHFLKNWTNVPDKDSGVQPPWQVAQIDRAAHEEAAKMGTTSIQTADASGWMVSITPSGGWIPAVVAGRTGVGLSQRMQSFELDEAQSPFNVLEPGKRPRVTLTPSLAVKDGKPWMAFSVQGGDTQDTNLLQFFLNRVEFGMNVQEAAEAANIESYQMRTSFRDHQARPGDITLRSDVPHWVVDDLVKRGYNITTQPRTSGPITAIEWDHVHKTFWGAASNYGDDYGIAW